MINLNRQPEPKVLEDNGQVWSDALQEAIRKHGSYKDIPEDEKGKILVHYRHQDIKSSLVLSSHGKCAFCECIPSEGGNIEVEHFKPKSIYPDLAFAWINLLPACRNCNGSKLDHDTVAEPIVNPYDQNPADFFYYDGISVKATNGANCDVAKRTIEVCGLESIRLWKPRADILVNLTIFTAAIEEATAEFHAADTDRKRVIRLRKLREALSTIETLTQESSKYSAFCKHYLEKCDKYLEAKRICRAQ